MLCAVVVCHVMWGIVGQCKNAVRQYFRDIGILIYSTLVGLFEESPVHFGCSRQISKDPLLTLTSGQRKEAGTFHVAENAWQGQTKAADYIVWHSCCELQLHYKVRGGSLSGAQSKYKRHDSGGNYPLNQGR